MKNRCFFANRARLLRHDPICVPNDSILSQDTIPFLIRHDPIFVPDVSRMIMLELQIFAKALPLSNDITLPWLNFKPASRYIQGFSYKPRVFI